MCQLRVHKVPDKHHRSCYNTHISALFFSQVLFMLAQAIIRERGRFTSTGKS